MSCRLVSVAFGSVCALLGAVASCANVSPELQRQIRTSTFEVVMKKPAADPATYEKPLPLELLPYVERTDAYRSVGTAFALGNNTYVTAAHVFIAGVDSQYGSPALRDAGGKIHPIANILKFSASEDFVVFSLADDLNITPLQVNRAPRLDDPVSAVGDALGDGIVIRDGLFTSETPEEQDGRWKWIRFSAAASPGNSGGPLLDAQGRIIALVIAKSVNENLNYALPMARVLDAPDGKAAFDQRSLVRVPFAQASKTYSFKDGFALPLSWEKFVRSYQAVVQHHANVARTELLAAYASSMFPRGPGTENILYDADTSDRGPALVNQHDDGNWAIDTPQFRETDLAGDGKIEVATVAGAVLLKLHRSNQAADDSFYGDSRAFMDLALKALNLRRSVGSDQVRVVSLGPAMTDTMTTDTYGRRWQLRVWPMPFMDMYVVAQLLPTPDGYVGLIAYASSSLLWGAKADLALLANQITTDYLGTLPQWRAFLARPALLPASLHDVALDARPDWKLHTHRFEMEVPPGLLKLDSGGEMLLSMNFGLDGPKVVWDTNGVWWYRDAQEKVWLGLWRKPRPPATARQQSRTEFDDLQARRSPYDGIPVQASSDAVDVSLSLQAPGTRAGMASSGVMYGLDFRLDGHPSPAQAAEERQAALRAVHVLERGVGSDIEAATPAMPPDLEAALTRLRDGLKQCDELGADLRGRLCTDDFNQYVVPLYRKVFESSIGSEAMHDLNTQTPDMMKTIVTYRMAAASAIRNRDLWQSFLARNHLPADTHHDPGVLGKEAALHALLEKGGPPTSEWTEKSQALAAAYVAERQHLAFRFLVNPPAIDYRPRQSACPAQHAADPVVSGPGISREVPRLTGAASTADYYPEEMRRQGMEGSVILSLKVDASGCVTEKGVRASSGPQELDEAALRWVETATFSPALEDGNPVAKIAPLKVTFSLR